GGDGGVDSGERGPHRGGVEHVGALDLEPLSGGRDRLGPAGDGDHLVARGEGTRYHVLAGASGCSKDRDLHCSPLASVVSLVRRMATLPRWEPLESRRKAIERLAVDKGDHFAALIAQPGQSRAIGAEPQLRY